MLETGEESGLSSDGRPSRILRHYQALKCTKTVAK